MYNNNNSNAEHSVRARGTGKTTILTVNRPAAATGDGRVLRARDAWVIAAQWRAAAAVDGGRGGGGGCVGGGMPRGSSIDWAPLFTLTTALSRHRRFITVRVFVWVPLFAPSAHRPTYIIHLLARPCTTAIAPDIERKD